MIKIRAFAQHPLLMFGLVLGILSMTFMPIQMKAEVAASNMNHLKSYSGQELFRGIFFLEGDIVDRVATLKRLKSEVEKNSVMPKDTERIISKIGKMSPGYFKNLENAVKSGNHYSVQQLIKDGANLLVLATVGDRDIHMSKDHYYLTDGKDLKMPDISQYDLTDSAQLEDAASTTIKTLSDNSNGEPQALVAVLIVVVAVALWFWFWGPDDIFKASDAIPKDIGTISNERFINEIISL